jgi:hypothetical protein
MGATKTRLRRVSERIFKGENSLLIREPFGTDSVVLVHGVGGLLRQVLIMTAGKGLRNPRARFFGGKWREELLDDTGQSGNSGI